MSKHVVLIDFTDLESKKVYRAGDPFPSNSQIVTDKRIKELSTKDNKGKRVYIELNDAEKAKVSDDTAKVEDVEVKAKAKEVKKEQPKTKK